MATQEEFRKQRLEELKKNVMTTQERKINRLSDNLETIPERVARGIPELNFTYTNSALDRYFVRGFTTPSVNVIAGGTGDGKSLCLLHLAYLSSYDHKILYISCENEITVDLKDRVSKIKERYKYYNEDNITYINVLDKLENENTDTKPAEVLQLINSGKYDMIFLDSYQVLFDTEASDGASLYQIGNTIMKALYGCSVKSKVAVFITWQLARIKVDSIDDIDENDISQSMGIARYANTMFAIKRSKKQLKNWKIKLIKSRSDFNFIKPIPLLFNDNFDLSNEKDVQDILNNLDFDNIDIEEDV